jgi:hypothetical protein
MGLASKALPWVFAALVPLSLFVLFPPHAWVLYTAWLGLIAGGALADAIHRLRNPPRIGAPTTFQRTGHRIVVTTNERAFEMDVTDVRRANWVGAPGELWPALVLGAFGAVVCRKELPDVPWHTQDFADRPMCTVDEAVFRRLLAAVDPEAPARVRVASDGEPLAEEDAEAQRMTTLLR